MEPQVAEAFCLIPYGIYLLLTGPKEKESAMVVSWVSQISYSPPMMAVVLRHNRPVLSILREGSSLSLNLLRKEQEPLIPYLKGIASLSLCGLTFLRGIEDIPYLKEALVSWFCQVQALLPFGDHVMVISKVINALISAGMPLTTLDYGKTYLGQE